MKERFSRAILRLQSSGELDLIRDQWWRNNVEAQMCYDDMKGDNPLYTQMDNHGKKYKEHKTRCH